MAQKAKFGRYQQGVNLLIQVLINLNVPNAEKLEADGDWGANAKEGFNWLFKNGDRRKSTFFRQAFNVAVAHVDHKSTLVYPEDRWYPRFSSVLEDFADKAKTEAEEAARRAAPQS